MIYHIKSFCCSDYYDNPCTNTKYWFCTVLGVTNVTLVYDSNTDKYTCSSGIECSKKTIPKSLLLKLAGREKNETLRSFLIEKLKEIL